jgi:hypothetical protein
MILWWFNDSAFPYEFRAGVNAFLLAFFASGLARILMGCEGSEDRSRTHWRYLDLVLLARHCILVERSDKWRVSDKSAYSASSTPYMGLLGRLVVCCTVALICFISYSSQIFIIWPWYGSVLSVELIILLGPFK